MGRRSTSSAIGCSTAFGQQQATGSPLSPAPQLTTNIPSNWGVRSAGIQVSNVAPLDVVSIHHGAGSWKKISYANTSYLEGGPAVGPVPEAVILGSKAGLIARPKDHCECVRTFALLRLGGAGCGAEGKPVAAANRPPAALRIPTTRTAPSQASTYEAQSQRFCLQQMPSCNLACRARGVDRRCDPGRQQRREPV